MKTPINPVATAQAAIARGDLVPAGADQWPGTPEIPSVKLPHEVGLAPIPTAKRTKAKSRPPAPRKYEYVWPKSQIGPDGRVRWIRSPA